MVVVVVVVVVVVAVVVVVVIVVVVVAAVVVVVLVAVLVAVLVVLKLYRLRCLLDHKSAICRNRHRTNAQPRCRHAHLVKPLILPRTVLEQINIDFPVNNLHEQTPGSRQNFHTQTEQERVR